MRHHPHFYPRDDWLKELMKSRRARKYIQKLFIFFEIAFYASILIGLALFLYLLISASA
ncbi:hypothetical protein J2741_000074 [Methanolinea mesophila]|nr:hypothetical protein [Methanolinea mesophila]